MIKKIGNFIWTWFIQGYIFVNIIFLIQGWLKTNTLNFYLNLNIIYLNLSKGNYKGILSLLLLCFLCSTLVFLLKHTLIATFNWFVESSWKMRMYIIISSCLIIYGVLRKIL
ncbi:hypothetical protein [Cetobacterium sp.]|uniref:hypothetical protein n=1 Tax=Cetobacterium sp. TaxID=2071632 RepID=UPI003F373372